MQLDSESWACRQCGAAFIGRKPDDLTCPPCTTGQNATDPAGAFFDRIHASPQPPGEVPGYDH